MNTVNTNSQRVVSLLVVALGLILITRWVFQIAAIDTVIPKAGLLGLNTPLMLLGCGAFLFLSSFPRLSQGKVRMVLPALVAFVATLSSLILVQHVFGISLGIDFVRIPTLPTVESPTPGRVAPNTCLAFLLAATSMGLALRKKRSLWQQRCMIAAVAGVMLIAISALVGHFLNLSALYRLARHNRMLAPTAFGLFVLSIGLWFKLQSLIDSEDTSVDAFRRRITRRSATIMTLVAISTGVAGFSIIEAGFEKSTSQNLLGTTVANAAALSSALEARLWFSRTMQSRPGVLRAYTTLSTNPSDKGALALLSDVGDSLLPSGVTSVAFIGADGKTLSESGFGKTTPDSLRMSFAPGEQRATLVWERGFFLQTESAMIVDERLVGKVLMEQALPIFENLISVMQKANDGSEVIICGHRDAELRCAPSRFNPSARYIPFLKADGTANTPLVPAAMLQSAVSRARDMRGMPALIAYAPLQNSGLGMTFTFDSDSLSAPMRENVVVLVGLIIVFVAFGVLMTRLQVQPLLAQVVYEQTRNKIILASSNDAFIGMDSEGRVTDWNARAESMFHWPAEEAIGQSLVEMIVPHAMRAAHTAGVKQFRFSGQGPVLNSQMEVNALQRDGTLIPVELSVTGFHDGRTFISNAFVRDISERKIAEKRLSDREKFLRMITDTLPALIGYVDTEERYQFANAGYRSLLGLDPAAILGKPIREVMGKRAYGKLRPRISEALAGNATHFEQEITLHGEVRHFLVDYIPDFDASDTVLGFYIMVLDISARKHSEMMQAQSEERLRLITDNLPVLIAYVDTEHRFRFGNETFRTWLGADPDALIGKSISDIVGAEGYAERLCYLDRAFQGETVHFEMTTMARGVQRVLQTVYVPHVLSDGTVDGLYTLSTDVTAMKNIERELSELARVDLLTELPNRRQFEERMEEAITRARRTGQEIGLLFLDIDRFKQINDSLGHAAGDTILREFGQRLKSSVRKTDVVARLAGDEFVIIIDGFKTHKEVSGIAKKILAAVRKPMAAGGVALHVTTSIGVTILDKGETDLETILARADEALYAAKKAGRDCFAEWQVPQEALPAA